MNKFKIGDHVRVTAEGTWFDQAGEVYDTRDWGYEIHVKFDDNHRAAFMNHELILADHEPHTTNDPVNHPAHYTSHPSGVECLTITRHMGFSLGNAVKYIWRADLKNDAIEDLKKAAFYIADEIKKREAK